MLAANFLKEYADENNKNVNGFTPDALESLMNYSWPGNVRELRTAIEHAVVLSRGEKISLRDLPPGIRNPAVRPISPAETSVPAKTGLTVAEAEKQLVIRTLGECDGNRTLAAGKLGMSRRTLHRKIHLYHLEEL